MLAVNLTSGSPLCRRLQYLEMIDDVMRNGVFRGDRTGTGALLAAQRMAMALPSSLASHHSLRRRFPAHPHVPLAGTYSKFGTTMRFNLRHSFPLLTSKRVFWRGEAPAAVPTTMPAAAARTAPRPAWAGPACMGLPVAAQTVVVRL